MAKVSNHLGLRGYVLDTKFGTRCDVTINLILTRFRQCVSAQRVAAMISLLRRHTPGSSQVLSAKCLHMLTCFILLTCFGLWNSQVIRGFGTYRKILTLAPQPRTAWAPADFCTCGLHTENEHYFGLVMQRFAPHRSQVRWNRTLQCFRTNACSSKGFRLTLKVLRIT